MLLKHSFASQLCSGVITDELWGSEDESGKFAKSKSNMKNPSVFSFKHF